MPLTEISGNVRRNGSQSRKSTQASSQGQSPHRVKPDTVSSMLRTSTETGDIGLFSSRPSRLPRSASRIPTRSRSGSLNPPASSLRPSIRRPNPRYDSRRLPRPMPSFSALSRHDTVRSNLTSCPSNPRTRSRAGACGPSGFDRRPSPANASGLYSQPSLMTLRGRPGYRPVSPAFSDAQSMPSYSRHPGFYRAASVATAASSPGSTFNRGAPYPYREMNHSASSLSRLPSPAIPGAYPGFRRSPFPSRNVTPVPVALQSSTRHPDGSVESFLTIPRSATGSTAPQYYDYSEAFVEEYSPYPPQELPISPLFSPDHAIPEQEQARLPRQAHTPFGMVPGSVFKPCEMPTQHNRTLSQQSKLNSCEATMGPQKDEKERVSNSEGNSEKAEITTEKTSRPSEQHSEEADPRRSSGLSRRTCPASPSTSFFPNASRNSRDLTSLAARVHSPTPKSGSVPDIEMMDEGEMEEDHTESSASRHGCATTDWELPSLHFRPLSFLHSSQGGSERPRSSGPVPRSHAPTIISPTPERPMSSQSRRRFSKILGLGDSDCSPVRNHQYLTRSRTSLNAGKLNSVLETAETSYPAEYSIPPFSPRNSMIAESTKDKESSIENTDHEQGSGCEKSTVESLLDKHIQCLGLQPETLADPVEDQNLVEDDGTQACTASTNREDETVRIISEPAPEHRLRARTVSLVNVPSTASAEQQVLVPRKLFSPNESGRPMLALAEPSPYVSSPSFQHSTGRPSLGWNTLTSTSNLSSDVPIPSQRTIRSSQLVAGNTSENVEGREVPTTQLSPSTSSCWSGDSEELYNWNNDVLASQRSSQRLLERQTSQRRRTRVRLKLKKHSQSQARMCASRLSSAHESFHTARAPSRDRTSVLEPLSKPNSTTIESRDTGKIENDSVHTARNAPPPLASKSNPPAASPDIPNRRSSVVATAPQRVKHSIDMARKMSVKTMRSHHSNASVVEPLNSTRLSAMAPHIDAPDLGPPLTSMSLNMNFAFPPAPVAAPAGLRATQSFFSDDSSAVQNPRASLRKRFNLPSLRSVLPSSPRAHSMVNTAGRSSEPAQPRLHQSCQMQGLKQEDEESNLHGTVGMSEFAYCRWRMLERVKGWWRRRTAQKKFGLKRRVDERVPSEGH